MMSEKELKKVTSITQEYLDELNWQHPFVNSDKFVDTSYSKWACKEILRSIESAKDAPFELTAVGLLDSFSEKMKQYAYRNSKNSLIFVTASETAEYLIEQCWIGEWRSNRRR